MAATSSSSAPPKKRQCKSCGRTIFDLNQVDLLDIVDDETAEIYGYDTY